MSNKYSPDNKNRPGDKVAITGTYEILNPTGKPTGEYRECTKNKIFPPTPKTNETFVLSNNNKRPGK